MDCILKGGIYITDSTGISTDRYERDKSETTLGGTTHDSPQFNYLIQRRYGPGIIGGDKGYDSEDNRLHAYWQYLTPMIREQENCGNSLIRVKMREDFYEDIYESFRGMVESIFGAMKIA